MRKIWAATTPMPATKGESVLLEGSQARPGTAEIGKDLCGDGILMFWTHDRLPVAVSGLARRTAAIASAEPIPTPDRSQFVTRESTFVTWRSGTPPLIRKPRRLLAILNWKSSLALCQHETRFHRHCCREWDKAEQKVRLVTHRVFQPSPDDPLDFEDTVETPDELANRFRVRRVLLSLANAERCAATRPRRNINPRISADGQQSDIGVAKSIRADRARQPLVYRGRDAPAVSRCVAIEGSRGWRIAKEKQSHKIDFVVALTMACWAAVSDANAGPGWSPDDRSRRQNDFESQTCLAAVSRSSHLILVSRLGPTHTITQEELDMSPLDGPRRPALGPGWRSLIPVSDPSYRKPENV